MDKDVMWKLITFIHINFREYDKFLWGFILVNDSCLDFVIFYYFHEFGWILWIFTNCLLYNNNNDNNKNEKLYLSWKKRLKSPPKHFWTVPPPQKKPSKNDNTKYQNLGSSCSFKRVHSCKGCKTAKSAETESAKEKKSDLLWAFARHKSALVRILTQLTQLQQDNKIWLENISHGKTQHKVLAQVVYFTQSNLSMPHTKTTLSSTFCVFVNFVRKWRLQSSQAHLKFGWKWTGVRWWR